MSTIPVTNMPQCTTHCLWVPKQDAESTWNHEHHSKSPTCQNAQLTNYKCQSRTQNGHETMSTIPSHQHARMHNSPPMSARAGCRMDMEPSAPFQSPTCQNAQLTAYKCQSRMQDGHETMSTIPVTNIKMHNSPTMSTRGGCRMDMKPWAPFQSPTCHNAQLTNYECQSRMQNQHETMSTIPVTNMPECTAHLLWVPEKDAEWTWNDEHHSSHHHARMHNSPTMSATEGCRMDMKPWAPFQSPTCQSAQLTGYECKRRMQNGHGTMSTIPVTNMPKCTTHWLWVPEKDAEWTWNHEQHSNHQHPRMHTHQLWFPPQDAEWTLDHEHHSSHHHARMHNSPSMSARGGCRMDMKLWAPFLSPTCQDAQLTDYECQSRTQNEHETMSTIPVTNMLKCTTHWLWVPEKDAEWTWNHEQHSHH